MAHGDYTGNSKAALAQKFQQQQELAAKNMSMVNAVVQEHRTDPINLFTEQDYEALHALVPAEDGSDEVIAVDVEDPRLKAAKFQASETVDQVTVGKDRHFNLQAGQVYIAPFWVVQHL